MSTPIQINNDEETIEISRADYEVLKSLAPAIAEQNALVLKSLDLLRGEMIAQAENQTTTFASLVDAIKAIKISVNVPEQAAPIVNLPAPVIEVKPANVRLTIPKIKSTKEKISRNRDSGLADTSVTVYEYEQ